MLLLVGATGFVGSYILEALDKKMAHDQVRCLVRSDEDRRSLEAQGWATARGDITDAASLPAALQGVDAVINLVSIIRAQPSKGATFEKVMGEGHRNLVDAAKQAGVKRFIYMSALGTSPSSTDLSQYYKYKWESEEYLRKSGLEYTIIRPSFLIGPGGEFAGLLKMLTLLPLVPVPGPGDYKVQPMYIRDLARYVVQLIDDPRGANQTLEVGGPEIMEFKQMLRGTLKAKNMPGVLLPVPLFLMKATVPLTEKIVPQLITMDQLRMMLGGSYTRDERLAEWGGFQRMSFVEAMRRALQEARPATSVRGQPAPATNQG
jgi:uncharacterized protein YbjT (DUF2867 family)